MIWIKYLNKQIILRILLMILIETWKQNLLYRCFTRKWIIRVKICLFTGLLQNVFSMFLKIKADQNAVNNNQRLYKSKTTSYKTLHMTMCSSCSLHLFENSFLICSFHYYIDPYFFRSRTYLKSKIMVM